MTWKSSYGNEPLHVWTPADWDTEVVRLPERAPLSDEAIARIIRSPIGCAPLREQVRGLKTVCIAIDDLTKPTEGHRVVPPILDELRAGGIQDSDIYFVISLGTHRALTLDDFRKKLGRDIAGRFRVYNHCPFENNQSIGVTSRGTNVSIDRHFIAADFKIGVGMLMPHNMAGFSGGGKIVLPGLAAIDTVEQNHRSTMRGLPGAIGVLEGNEVRADIDEAARMAGLGFIVNGIHNERGETVELFAGDVVEAYRNAFGCAVDYYGCRVRYDNDVGIFNAFPRDNWLLLSLSSLDIWSTRDPDKAIVRPGGTIVIINHCSEGAGEHGLHTRGMRHFVYRDKHGIFAPILETRRLIFFSPNLNEATLRDYYAGPVELYDDWGALMVPLTARHGPGTRAAVFPCGTLQMDRSVSEPKAGRP